MVSQININRLQVIHSTPVWLAQTMTWLYSLVKNPSPYIENHVVSYQLRNLDQFPIERLVSWEQDSLYWRFLCSKSWKMCKWRQSYLMSSLIKKSGAQILHSHFGNHGWQNIRTAKSYNLKHVITFYGADASVLPQAEPIWIDRYVEMFEAVQLVLCEGPHFRETLIKLGCPKEKVKVQHLSVNLEEIHFSPRYWQPGEPLKVLISGTFVEKKGIPYAIKALGRIRKVTPLEITVIGDENGQERSRQEKAKILASIKKNGLSSSTCFLGYQSHLSLLEEAYKNHIFLSPSVTSYDGDTEGGAPVTIIEMVASGMPVVSSIHCDIPEVIEDGITGLLAEERDVDGLERKLTWLIDNPERWIAMSTAAREHVEREFNPVTQSERLATHYFSVVN